MLAGARGHGHSAYTYAYGRIRESGRPKPVRARRGGGTGPHTQPPREAVGLAGRMSASVGQAMVQVAEPIGKLFPVELAVKPKVVDPSGLIVPL